MCSELAAPRRADGQVTLAEQVEAAAMRSSDRTRDGHGAGVCVSMFMEYAFTPAVNLGLVPPPI